MRNKLGINFPGKHTKTIPLLSVLLAFLPLQVTHVFQPFYDFKSQIYFNAQKPTILF
jgi:hypothetical protein